MNTKLEIIYKSETDITPYINNTRTHSPEQIEQIKSSINEFGMCSAIGIHNGSIVYGHARFIALKQLGYTEFPTLDLSHLSDAQRKAYIIADNNLAINAGWDNELLKIELGGLEDLEFDVRLLGFDDGFMSGLNLEVEHGTTNAMDEWTGMPEFTQDDKTSFRHLTVHFANNDDANEFFSIIGQSNTDKTRSIWFPEAEIETTADKEYS
jgi:hypothetical protein